MLLALVDLRDLFLRENRVFSSVMGRLKGKGA